MQSHDSVGPIRFRMLSRDSIGPIRFRMLSHDSVGPIRFRVPVWWNETEFFLIWLFLSFLSFSSLQSYSLAKFGASTISLGCLLIDKKPDRKILFTTLGFMSGWVLVPTWASLYWRFSFQHCVPWLCFKISLGPGSGSNTTYAWCWFWLDISGSWNPGMVLVPALWLMLVLVGYFRVLEPGNGSWF